MAGGYYSKLTLARYNFLSWMTADSIHISPEPNGGSGSHPTRQCTLISVLPCLHDWTISLTAILRQTV